MKRCQSKTYVATFASGEIIIRRSTPPLLWAWRIQGAGPNFNRLVTHVGWSATQEAAGGALGVREKTWRIISAEVVPAVPVLEGAPDADYFAIGMHEFKSMLADYPTYGTQTGGRLILLMKDPNLTLMPWNAWLEYPGDAKREGMFLRSHGGRRATYRSKEAAALAALIQWAGKENAR